MVLSISEEPVDFNRLLPPGFTRLAFCVTNAVHPQRPRVTLGPGAAASPFRIHMKQMVCDE